MQFLHIDYAILRLASPILRSYLRLTDEAKVTPTKTAT